MVTSELGRWSRTAENTTELLTSIITVNYNTGTPIEGGNSHNGVKRQRKKASTTKCPYTVPGLDKFHVSTNYSFKVKRINYSNFNHHHHVPEGLGVFSVP